MELDFDSLNWSSMMVDSYNIKPKQDIRKLFPGVFNFKEYYEELHEVDITKFLRFIPMCYDKNSPLRQHFTEINRLKIKAADLAGFVRQEDGENINMSDFLMIERLVAQGRLNHAEAMITFKLNQSREQRIKLQQDNMKLNAENANQTEMLKAENEMKKIKFEADQEIRIEAAKALFKLEGTSNETILRLQEQMIMNTLAPQTSTPTQEMQQ